MTNSKPLTTKHMTDLLRAGAPQITQEQWVAGMERGLRGMLEAGFVFYADYIDRLPRATARRMGF